MISQLWNRVNYVSGLKFLFSTYIREYDISKANINILYTRGVIDKNLYDKLSVASREERQITIGLLQQRDRNVIKELTEGIKQAKKALFELNALEDTDILTIKNDAVFIVGKNLKHTQVSEYVEFKLKNTFTNFVNVTGIEIYYGYDRVSGIENIDVKGLGKNKYLHDNFMTDFIIYIMNSLEVGETSDAVSSFVDFYDDYVSGRLDIGYYREYNSASMYSIMNTHYKVFNADNDEYTKTKVIDISYNLAVLRELFSMISGKYFTGINF